MCTPLPCMMPRRNGALTSSPFPSCLLSYDGSCLAVIQWDVLGMTKSLLLLRSTDIHSKAFDGVPHVGISHGFQTSNPLDYIARAVNGVTLAWTTSRPRNNVFCGSYCQSTKGCSPEPHACALYMRKHCLSQRALHRQTTGTKHESSSEPSS